MSVALALLARPVADAGGATGGAGVVPTKSVEDEGIYATAGCSRLACRLRGGMCGERVFDEILRRKAVDEARQRRLERGRAQGLLRRNSWQERLRRTWRTIKKVVWGGHARRARPERQAAPAAAAALGKRREGSALPPSASIGGSGNASAAWDWRQATQDMRLQRELQMLKEKRTFASLGQHRSELELRARPLAHSMSMLTSHVDGRATPVLGAQVPRDLVDALSEDAEAEAEEAHAATNARVASDAPVEITVSAAELAHLSFDQPVMAVLVQRAKLEDAVEELRDLLLTPSAPECSTIKSERLHKMSQPASVKKMDPSVAAALLLRQTFRYCRLEQVPGEQGERVRRVAMGLEAFCIADVFNWKATILESIGRMIWVRALHTHALLGKDLAPVVESLAPGDLTDKEAHLALMWHVGVPSLASQVAKWRQAVQVVIAEGWRPSLAAFETQGAPPHHAPSLEHRSTLGSETEDARRIEWEMEDKVELSNLTADWSVLKCVRVEGFGQEAAIGHVAALRMWISEITGRMRISEVSGAQQQGTDDEQQGADDDEGAALQDDDVMVHDEKGFLGHHLPHHQDAGDGLLTPCVIDGQGAEVSPNGDEEHGREPMQPSLILERGPGQRPFLVPLRGSEGVELAGQTGEELKEALQSVPRQVRRSVLTALHLGVPGMLVGEVACVFVDLEQEPADITGDASCGSRVEVGAGERRMVQVEMELLGLDMQCVTADGSILARIQHESNPTTNESNTTIPHPHAVSHASTADLCDEVTDSQQVTVHSAMENSEKADVLHGSGDSPDASSVPRAGDVAVVSYLVRYRGQLLLDLREPHEVKLGVGQASQELWEEQGMGAEMPPGLHVLLLRAMRKGSTADVSLEGYYALGHEHEELMVMGCGERIQVELSELPLDPSDPKHFLSSVSCWFVPVLCTPTVRSQPAPCAQAHAAERPHPSQQAQSKWAGQRAGFDSDAGGGRVDRLAYGVCCASGWLRQRDANGPAAAQQGRRRRKRRTGVHRRGQSANTGARLLSQYRGVGHALSTRRPTPQANS